MNAGEPLIIVAVYIRGDRLRPDEISRWLRIQPTRSQEKGVLVPGVKPVVAKIGLWGLIAETKSPSIADHVDELLGKLRSTETPINKLTGVEEAYLDVFIAPDNETKPTAAMEAVIREDHIQALSRLGLSIHFTVSY